MAFFALKTTDGTLEMKNVPQSLGENYLVSLNRKIIDAIAEKLNLTIVNLVLDNLVIYVRNGKYAAIMTALAVMVAKELRLKTKSWYIKLLASTA